MRFPAESSGHRPARRVLSAPFMRKNLFVLSFLALAACTQAPATEKAGDLESRLLGETVSDTDLAADGYTRRLTVAGAIGFGESLDATFPSSGYRGWVFTAAAGARVSLDAMATDGSDTVLMLYGPQTASGWSRARPIAVNDDYRGSTNSHLDVRVSRAGTYLAVVREYYEDPGAFTLTLACSGAECRTECGAAGACPTGAECQRVYCIRAPCPSYCAPVVPVHAGDLCDESLCGPRPRSVTLMCSDGSVGGNTGRCLRNADLVCGWEIRSCPADTYCGGRLGNTCAANQFCDFADSAMCGYADGTGVCRVRPEACTADMTPVCGCNGQTYSNACTAQSQGVDVLHTGGC